MKSMAECIIRFELPKTYNSGSLLELCSPSSIVIRIAEGDNNLIIISGNLELKKIQTVSLPAPSLSFIWVECDMILVVLSTGHLSLIDHYADDEWRVLSTQLIHNKLAENDISARLLVSEGFVWILFSDGVVCSVPMHDLLSQKRCTLIKPYGDFENNCADLSCVKLQLIGQEEVHDITACYPRAPLFETSTYQSHLIIGVGRNPAIATYTVGKDVDTFSLGQVAWAVAGKLVGMAIETIGGTVGGVLNFVGFGKRLSEGNTADVDDLNRKLPPATDLSLSCIPLDDSFRAIKRIWASPSGNLAAAVDGFGRVLLLDMHLGGGGTVVRMWKGLRDATCGWFEVAELWDEDHLIELNFDGNPVVDNAHVRISLYLAILAPCRGHVQIWQMPHGPCVRIIAVPFGISLRTIRAVSFNQHESTRKMFQCYVLSVFPDGISVEFRQLSVLMTHLKLIHNPKIDENNARLKIPTVQHIIYEIEKLQRKSNSLHKSSILADTYSEPLLTLLESFVQDDVPESQFVAALEAIDNACEAGLILSAEFYLKTATFTKLRASLSSSDGEEYERLNLRCSFHDLYVDIMSAHEHNSVEVHNASDAVDFMPASTRGWELHGLACECLEWVALANLNTQNKISSNSLPHFPSFLKVAECVLEKSGKVHPALCWKHEIKDMSSANILIAWMFYPLLDPSFGIRSLEKIFSHIAEVEISELLESTPIREVPYISGFTKWFFELSPQRAVSLTLKQDARSCTILRWLRSQLIEASKNIEVENASICLEHLLRPIYDACRSSPLLESAMVLAVVAGEAQLAAALQVEAITLGTISLERGKRWNLLARKLRACLFLNHQISKCTIRMQESKFYGRFTVQLLEEGKASFSIASLIAKEQLILYKDISILACRNREAAELFAAEEWWRTYSSIPSKNNLFDVTQSHADNMQDKILHVAKSSLDCMNAGGSGSLLIFPKHAQPLLLACHRTRLLLLSWISMDREGQLSDSLQPLGAVVEHLSFISAAHETFVGLISYDLWNSGLCQYLSNMTHDCSNISSSKGAVLHVVLSAAEQFLRCVNKIAVKDGNVENADIAYQHAAEFVLKLEAECSNVWPGAPDQWLRECCSRISNNKRVLPSTAAIEAHVVVIQALRVAATCSFSGIEALNLFPSSEYLFTQTSLEHDRDYGLRIADSSDHYKKKRMDFFCAALKFIQNGSATAVYDLAQCLGENFTHIRVLHFRSLLMYGHDQEAENLINDASNASDEMIKEVIKVSRHRLSMAVHVAASHPTLLAELDPEMIEWIRGSCLTDELKFSGKGSLRSLLGLLEAASRAAIVGNPQWKLLNQMCLFTNALIRGLG